SARRAMFVDPGVTSIALRQEGHVCRPGSDVDRPPPGGPCLHHVFAIQNICKPTLDMELLTEFDACSLVRYKHETPDGVPHSQYHNSCYCSSNSFRQVHPLQQLFE